MTDCTVLLQLLKWGEVEETGGRDGGGDVAQEEGKGETKCERKRVLVWRGKRKKKGCARRVPKSKS